jgi:two-component system response regulator MprA
MRRILVIDDDPSVLSFLRRGLKLAGFEIKTASQGAEGLELLQEFEPHLVILDRMLVGMGSPEVLDRLRQTCPELPVIMLTGRDAEAGEEIPVDAYLIKPVAFDTLMETVGRLLGTPS